MTAHTHPRLAETVLEPTRQPLIDLGGNHRSLASWAREFSVHPNAVARWRDNGILGADGERHYLEAFKVGGRWRISRSAAQRFLAALNQKKNGAVTLRTPAEARKADTRAREELAAAGF
jgi:hypothetical protein